MAVIGAAFIVVAWFASAHSGDFDDSRTRIQEERIRGRELDEGYQLAEARSNLKHYWVAELLAGRADLAAVADRFIEADRDCAGCITEAERKCPGCSEGEKAARSVLPYVRIRVENATAPAESWALVMAQFQSRYDGPVEPGPSFPVPMQVQAPMPMENG